MRCKDWDRENAVGWVLGETEEEWMSRLEKEREELGGTIGSTGERRKERGRNGGE